MLEVAQQLAGCLEVRVFDAGSLVLERFPLQHFALLPEFLETVPELGVNDLVALRKQYATRASPQEALERCGSGLEHEHFDVVVQGVLSSLDLKVLDGGSEVLDEAA